MTQTAGHTFGLVANGIASLFSSAPSASAPHPQPTQVQKVALKIDALAQKTITYLFPIADLIGVIRNLLDLILLVGIMVLSPWFVQTVVVLGQTVLRSALILGHCIAGFRIVQGCLSIAIGISKLYLALRAYQRCKENHDAASLAVAKDQIKSAVLNIVTGLFWISLGILVLSCPQAMIAATTIGIVFTVLQWTLFYGLFTSDAILSLKMANNSTQSIDRHYLYFINEILNNKQLTTEQMKAATKRFLERISKVSSTEKGKLLEKLHINLGHNPLQSEIETRMIQKRAKKCADLGRTLGLDPDSIKDILEASDPVSRVLESFETSRAQQNASKMLAIFSMIVNAMAIPCDFSTFAQFLKADHFEIIRKISDLLQKGKRGQAFGVALDGGGVALINQAHQQVTNRAARQGQIEAQRFEGGVHSKTMDDDGESICRSRSKLVVTCLCAWLIMPYAGVKIFLI